MERGCKGRGAVKGREKRGEGERNRRGDGGRGGKG